MFAHATTTARVPRLHEMFCNEIQCGRTNQDGRRTLKAATKKKPAATRIPANTASGASRGPLKPRIDLSPYFPAQWWLTCTVKILIVTDSSGGFDPAIGFHLGTILNVLADDPWSHVSFSITKAHRGVEASADINNFDFNTHNLAQYSQIWLFGIETASGALSQPELRKLAEFMDGGGGVFATGDHQNLGQAMCAEVPRVRSMRRWYFPNPGPNGEPVAPDQTGPDRHDTVMDTDPGTPGLQGSQSDKVPQPVRPRYYTRIAGTGIIKRLHKFPHPVLCGPDGVITYLPDHMHEGLCEVPANLGNSFTFNGYHTVEYPAPGGTQERPEVIAWATTRNTTNAEFGVLAAYDGHRAGGIGRVVVDATWHHWFNINLVGFVNATDPGHLSYDPAVIPKWESIKAYFRNVALWLARPTLQDCLRNGGWLIAIKYYDIQITARDLNLVPDVLTYYWQLGVFARDAMGRLASQCQTTRWILDWIDWLPWRFDPWPPIRKEPLPDPPSWLPAQDLETVAMGGAIHALTQAFGREQDPGVILSKDAKKVEHVARQGAAAAIEAIARHYASAAKQAEKLADRAAEKAPKGRP